jgi:hypothetical protein
MKRVAERPRIERREWRPEEQPEFLLNQLKES